MKTWLMRQTDDCPGAAAVTDPGSLDQARTLNLRQPARVCRGLAVGLTLGLTALLGASLHARDLDPQVVAKWPGFSRGSASAMAVAGDYAYLAAGSLQVIDVRDPAHPQRVRGYPTLHGVRDVAVMGRYAYVVDDTAGFCVIDLDNPAATPARVGGDDAASGYPETVVVSGDHVIVTGSWNTGSGLGMQLFDVRDPTRPQRVGGYSIVQPTRALVRSALAYVVDGRVNRLHVVDLSDPSRPRQVGSYDSSVSPHSLALSGDYLILGGSSLEILDVRDPANPQKAGSYDNGDWVTRLVASGDQLYVGRGSGFEVLDIRDPAHLKRIGGDQNTGGATLSGLAMAGRHLYLSDWQGGFRIMDVSTPNQPRRLGSFHTGGDVLGVAVSGQYAYLADGVAGLQVISISDPSRPQRAGGLVTTNGALGLEVSGDHAYVLESRRDDQTGLPRSRLEVFHVGEPSAPRRMGGTELSGAAAGIAVSGKQACVVGSDGDHWTNWLEVIDVSDPSNPRRIGRYDASIPAAQPHYGRNPGVAMAGPYAYMVSCRSNEQGLSFGRLEVIDVGDPAKPRMVGAYEAEGEATGVAVAGGYAYVTGYRWVEPTDNSLHSLTVFDIRDPANPRRVGGSKRGGSANSVTVSGNFAYVANQLYGIEVFEVSNPAAPVLVGSYETGGDARSLAVSGSYGFVASAFFVAGTWYWARGEALVVVDLRKPANPQRVGEVGSGRAVQDVVVSGSHAYIAKDGLEIADLHDPVHPRLLGNHTVSEPVVDVAVSEPYAYVLEAWDVGNQGRGRLEVIDVSDKAMPRKIGGYETSQRAVRAVVWGDSAYLAEAWYAPDSERSRLSVLDVRDPAQPRLRAAYTADRTIVNLAVSNHYAYLVRGGAGLEIVDCTDGANPRSVGGYKSSGYLSAVAVSGRWAAVGTAAFGPGFADTLVFTLLDINDPAHPRSLGEVALSGSATDIALWGQHAYVAAGRAGVHVVDLSDPAHLRRVGGNSTFVAQAVALHDGRALVASSDGMFLLDRLTPLRFGPPQVGTDGMLHLSLTGVSGERARVQRSADFVAWEDWQSVTLGPTPTELTAEPTQSERQFFRAFEELPRP